MLYVKRISPSSSHQCRKVLTLSTVNSFSQKVPNLFRGVMRVEQHKEEVYSLMWLREFLVGLYQISPLVEVALRLLLQKFNHKISNNYELSFDNAILNATFRRTHANKEFAIEFQAMTQKNCSIVSFIFVYCDTESQLAVYQFYYASIGRQK